MTIEAWGNSVDKEKWTARLLECRKWIDEKLQECFDNSNANIEDKKLLAKVSSNLVLYVQECATAVFNFTNTVNKD